MPITKIQHVHLESWIFFELTSSWELKFMTNAIEAGKHIAMLSDVTLNVWPQTSQGALGLPGSQVSYTSLVYSHS